MSVPSEFIDVDFRKCPQFVAGDTSPHTFGLDTGLCYEDKYGLVPKDQWQALADKLEAEKAGLDYLITRVYNQKSEGSCVANATSQAHEVKQAWQYGKDLVTHLSAISLYKRIGSSPGSGAMVSDGISEGSKRGILPLDTAENKAKYKHTMPNTGWSTPMPSGWEETAKLFRFDEVLVVRSVDGLISALFEGHPVVVGRAGHSICYLRPTYSGGSLKVIYVNSWGEWGFSAGGLPNGFGADSTGLISSSAGWAAAIRSVVVPRIAA